MALSFPQFRFSFIPASCVALVAAIPLFLVFYSASSLDSATWKTLLAGRIAELSVNTILLAAGVAVLSVIFGVAAAWFTWRFKFRGVRLLRAFLLLPLIIPPYVLASVYTSLEQPLGVGLHNYWGALLVLSVSGYPYIMLLVLKALHKLSPNYEEAASLAGASSLTIFVRVTLPLLRRPIIAGVVLVALHVLADYGAVSLLTYDTFTQAIYRALEVSQKDSYIAALSSLPLLLGVLLLYFHEAMLKGSQRVLTANGQALQRHPVKFWLIILVCLLFFVAVISPLAWMLYWTVINYTQLMSAGFTDLLLNSLSLSAVVAIITGVLAVAVAWVSWRWQGKASACLNYISTLAFALPGPVLALGIAVLVGYWDGWLDAQGATFGYMGYTFIGLCLALVIRFLPVAIQTESAGLQAVNHQMLDAAASLGARSREQFVRVVLPNIQPSIFAAMVLVFIETIKELPVTMFLRPDWFDTLPIAIWVETNDERIELAAPASLVLVMLSIPALLRATREVS